MLALLVGSHAFAQSPEPLALSLADGQLQAEETFTELAGVRELSDGRVIIIDWLPAKVMAVDWDVGRTTAIGRTGEGPGEYARPVFVFPLAEDSTLVTDDSHRWHVMAGARIVETMAADRPLSRLLGIELSGADKFGHVLGVEPFLWENYPIPAGRAVADSLMIIRARRGPDGSALAVDTVARAGGMGRLGVEVARNGGMIQIRSSPLSTEDQAQLFSDGWIAIAWAEPYRVDWMRPDGSWIRGSALEPDPIPVDRRERCFALQLRGQDPDRCDASGYPPFPDFVPPFRRDALLPAPDGSLVVARTPSHDLPHPRYDIVDRSGKRVAQLTLQPNQHVLGFGARSVYVVTTDEVDLQRLTRHPWPPVEPAPRGGG